LPSTWVWAFSAEQICASYCSTVAGAIYAGVEDGTDCYCGAAGEKPLEDGALGEESCSTLCDSNPESTCGGLGAIEVKLFEKANRRPPATLVRGGW